MIAIRPTREEDLPALSDLFRDGFGSELAPEAWEWKYRRLPGESRSLLAVDAAGRLLAHAGALALPARWRGGEGPVWQLVDFLGRRAGSGLRPGMVPCGRALLADLPRPADLPWIYGFPGERHFLLGQRTFGYRPLAEIVPWAGALPEDRETGGQVRLEVSDHCGAWATEAEEAWERCGVASVRRSAGFLNWRYHARPARYYRFYRIGHGGGRGVAGLAVFAFLGDQAWAAEAWLPGPPAEWEVGLRAVAADLAASGMRGWRFWPLPAEGGETLFRALGLEPRPERVVVGCRGGEGGPDPVAAARGFVTPMGDHDLV